MLVRALLVTFLLVVAAVSAAVGFGALSNLWADYQDSPASTYLLIGIPAVAFAFAALWAAIGLARDTRRAPFRRRR